MGALFTIIEYSISNLFIGVFLTLIGLFLMYFIIGSWFKNKSFTVLSFIVGGILFFLLSFQSVLLCGAVTIKTYSEDVEAYINSAVSNISTDYTFDEENSQKLLELITEEKPLVGYFVGGADFTGHTPDSIAEAFVDELRSFMNKFILRRVAWSLAFVILGAVIVINSMEGGSGRSRTSSRSGRSGSSVHRRRRYDY